MRKFQILIHISIGKKAFISKFSLTLLINELIRITDSSLYSCGWNALSDRLIIFLCQSEQLNNPNVHLKGTYWRAQNVGRPRPRPTSGWCLIKKLTVVLYRVCWTIPSPVSPAIVSSLFRVSTFFYDYRPLIWMAVAEEAQNGTVCPTLG